ncbi:hypothetical protein D3C76_795050 [compost metagenome]
MKTNLAAELETKTALAAISVPLPCSSLPLLSSSLLLFSSVLPLPSFSLRRTVDLLGMRL